MNSGMFMQTAGEWQISDTTWSRLVALCQAPTVYGPSRYDDDDEQRRSHEGKRYKGKDGSDKATWLR